MNFDILFFYIAIGSLAKLLTLRYPTPGQQWAAGLEVVAGGVLLGIFVPPELTGPVMLGVGTPFAASLFGHYVGRLIDIFRLRKDARRDYGRADQTDGPPSPRVEWDG